MENDKPINEEKIFLANARVPTESPLFLRGEVRQLNGRVAPESMAMYPGPGTDGNADKVQSPQTGMSGAQMQPEGEASNKIISFSFGEGGEQD